MPRETVNPHIAPGSPAHEISYPDHEKGSTTPRPLPQTPGPAPYVNTPCERVNETGDGAYVPQKYPKVDSNQ